MEESKGPLIGKLENEIIEMVNSKKIELAKIDELFNIGANPNALEYAEPDEDFDCDIYWATLFSECIFSSQEKGADLYPLLKSFIKYGLDVNKFGASIIGDFTFVVGKSDIYEMTKLILENMDKNINVNQALSGIGLEESFLNCSFDNRDGESNDLFGLYELIDAFSHNKAYKSFYRLPKKINEKFVKINVNGDFVVLDKNKIAVKSEKDKMCMISKIMMEKNTLIIEDNYGVYINNEDQNKYDDDNIFTINANEYFKKEKIINLKFKHYQVKLSAKSFAQGRVVTINFTNNKKLVYKEDADNNLESIEIE